MAEITDELVAGEAAGLGAGGRHYTARQLYYAVCAAVEVPRIALAPGVIGTGIILLLVAAIVFRIAILACVLGGIGALLLLYGARLRVLEAHRLTAVRARALGYEDFVRRFVDPHRHDSRHLPGLIDVATWEPTHREPDGVLLVCDTDENAALVAALVAEEELAVTVTDAPRVDLEAAHVIAFHDASVRGCAFPLDLEDRVGHPVIDGGIRPRDVIGVDLQEIEGAPGIRPPRDITSLLDVDEAAWLFGGRRLEMAAFPRERLVALIQAALNPSDDESDAGDGDSADDDGDSAGQAGGAASGTAGASGSARGSAR